MPEEQAITMEDLAENFPRVTDTTSPATYALMIVDPKRPRYSLEFHTEFSDIDTANRVAKALIHAVELCGGGKKDEPF
jgi:hypothetical protein